jgi:hypothetical protein
MTYKGLPMVASYTKPASFSITILDLTKTHRTSTIAAIVSSVYNRIAEM